MVLNSDCPMHTLIHKGSCRGRTYSEFCFEGLGSTLSVSFTPVFPNQAGSCCSPLDIAADAQAFLNAPKQAAWEEELQTTQETIGDMCPKNMQPSIWNMFNRLQLPKRALDACLIPWLLLTPLQKVELCVGPMENPLLPKVKVQTSDQIAITCWCSVGSDRGCWE